MTVRWEHLKLLSQCLERAAYNTTCSDVSPILPPSGTFPYRLLGPCSEIAVSSPMAFVGLFLLLLHAVCAEMSWTHLLRKWPGTPGDALGLLAVTSPLQEWCQVTDISVLS